MRFWVYKFHNHKFTQNSLISILVIYLEYRIIANCRNRSRLGNCPNKYQGRKQLCKKRFKGYHSLKRPHTHKSNHPKYSPKYSQSKLCKARNNQFNDYPNLSCNNPSSQINNNAYNCS
jgi:hypothetical protein